AVGREPVLDARGHLLERLAAHDALRLQRLERLGERARADAAEDGQQLVEADAGVVAQRDDDAHRPLLADDVDGAADDADALLGARLPDGEAGHGRAQDTNQLQTLHY